MNPRNVYVSGPFDALRSREMRLLQEASKFGAVHALLWTDQVTAQNYGKAPLFPFAERKYFLSAIRYVTQVVPVTALSAPNQLPPSVLKPGALWVDLLSTANDERRDYCRRVGLEYRALQPDELTGFPEPAPSSSALDHKKVVVTGCYDWFHSGHIRFFEEAASYGDLYVIVGHDANIRLLKGGGHPLLPEEERRYMAGSIRFVRQALISSGEGWLDADPEIRRLKPDFYAVNEDGDRGGKREYCQKMGIQYIVLKRLPAPGLPARTSTELRGF